jgi:K+ transporter
MPAREGRHVPELTPETVQKVWIVTLVIYFVVLLVVATLLTLILRTARDIHGGVSAIWNVGQRIANNTIHIALLNKTNIVAGQILASAVGIVNATAGVEAHARECPGCPACIIGPEWMR